jgi:hypothetical protein
MTHTSFLATWEADIQKMGSRPAHANSSRDPISEIARAKCSGGVAQVEEHLFCQQKALSSNPLPTKNKTNKKIGNLPQLLRHLLHHHLANSVSHLK